MASGPATRPGEDDIIETIFAPLATDPGADGLVDDAAVIRAGPGEEIVVTQDALAADVHFFADDPPGAIAAKALRVNVSDLVAKGAVPFGYTLALALGGAWTRAWLEDFAAGLAADQQRYGLSLLGGDTLRAAGKTHIAVTAFGRLPAGTIVRRRTARPGDILVVTGTVGDAALHVAGRTDPARMASWQLSGEDTAVLRERYLYPDPPVAAAPVIRRHARAAMDVSDGLFLDGRKLARAAGVGVRLDRDLLPLSPAARRTAARDPAVTTTAMTGGDDYQVLAALAPDRLDAFRGDLAAVGIAATVVGAVTAGEGTVAVFDGGRPVTVDEASAFRHF